MEFAGAKEIKTSLYVWLGPSPVRSTLDKTLYLDGAQTGSRQPVLGQEAEEIECLESLLIYCIGTRSMAIVVFALLHCQNKHGCYLYSRLRSEPQHALHFSRANRFLYR